MLQRPWRRCSPLPLARGNPVFLCDDLAVIAIGNCFLDDAAPTNSDRALIDPLGALAFVLHCGERHLLKRDLESGERALKEAASRLVVNLDSLSPRELWSAFTRKFKEHNLLLINDEDRVVWTLMFHEAAACLVLQAAELAQLRGDNKTALDLLDIDTHIGQVEYFLPHRNLIVARRWSIIEDLEERFKAVADSLENGVSMPAHPTLSAAASRTHIWHAPLWCPTTSACGHTPVATQSRRL